MKRMLRGNSREEVTQYHLFFKVVVSRAGLGTGGGEGRGTEGKRGERRGAKGRGGRADASLASEGGRGTCLYEPMLCLSLIRINAAI